MSKREELIPPDFYVIPLIVRETKGLRPTDWIVYAVIYWFTKMKGERCFASNETIAKVAGTTPGTVKNSLSRLRKKRLVKIEMICQNQRSEIIPLVSFNLVQPSPNGYGTVTKWLRQPSPNGAHNKKNRKRITNTQSPDGDPEKKSSKKSPKGNDLSLIVDRYFEIRGLEATAYQSHLRAAKQLLQEAGGDVALARRWLDDIGGYLEGLVKKKRIKTWRIDAILKNLSDYFAGNI